MENSDKMWAGRFTEKTEKIVEDFNASISFDKRMALFDVKGSIAHAKMLSKQGVIPEEDACNIERGLNQIIDEIKENKFEYRIEDEDIHMAVERRLTAIVGDAGGRLHTARSRNDQVALDFRLYLKSGAESVRVALQECLKAIYDKARANLDVIMPGYTHLQTAQPVLYSHYIMAYFQMLRRDYERFCELLERMDYSPLGACALAGTSFDIDRNYTAQLLGFKAPTENSIDSVSDRDFALEFLSDSAICMMHLSRFCEELILHSTSEFAFIELSDGFCTGSSIMPQKKNPDIPELIRGKTGRVYGHLMGLFTVMKGLPLAYNKDMQEDKEGVFDALDTVYSTIRIFTQMLSRIAVKKDKMYEAAEKGFSTATDMADYLVKKGLAFRSAHHVVGRAVQYASSNGKMLSELTLDELKSFSELIEDDIFSFITVESSVNSRKSYGGTSRDAVMIQLENACDFLKRFE